MATQCELAYADLPEMKIVNLTRIGVFFNIFNQIVHRYATWCCFHKNVDALLHDWGHCEENDG